MRLRQPAPVGACRTEAQAQIINHFAHATQAIAETFGGFAVGDRAGYHRSAQTNPLTEAMCLRGTDRLAPFRFERSIDRQQTHFPIWRDARAGEL